MRKAAECAAQEALMFEWRCIEETERLLEKSFFFAWRSLQYACGAVERLWSTDNEITAASEKAWVLLAVFQWRRLFLKQTYILWRSERSVVVSFC